MTHRHCVLVVEDDADARQALAALLEVQGHCVVTAADGREALDKLGNGVACCAIVLDLMMPGMDGWRFRSEQLRDPAIGDLPLMLLSAHGNLRDSARMLGVRDFMPKPVDVDGLIEWVRSRCQRAH